VTTISRGFALSILLLAAGCAKPANLPETAPMAGPCTENIRVVAGRVDGAAGHRYLVLVFDNVDTTRTCRMVGYPRVDLVDESGHVVAHAQDSLRGMAGLPASVKAPQPVTLRPGKSASAIVEAGAIPEGDAAECKEYSLMVTPPGQHSAVPAGPVMMPNCDVQVHPVVAGDARNG
jgi:hypothetical protein